MATVPNPRTWTNGEFVTDAIMNGSTGVRDPLDFLLDPPQCQAYGTTAQSIPNSAVTGVTLDVESYDTENIHSTVSSTNRFTIVTAGWYEVFAEVIFSANATGSREVRAVKNGSTPVLGRGVGTPNAAQACACTIPGVLMQFAAGDTLDLSAFQTSGGSLALQAGSGINSFMRIKWDHP